MAAYLTTLEARTLAATLPGLAALLALDDAVLAATLELATLDVDTAQNYQGHKCDQNQKREFPRVAYGQPVEGQLIQVPALVPMTPDTVIWDWDPAANAGVGAAVVPDKVLLACLYQAAWLLNPKYAARLENIRSGLASQGIGTASESLQKPGEMDQTGLCDRAARIMNKYRLRSGRML